MGGLGPLHGHVPSSLHCDSLGVCVWQGGVLSLPAWAASEPHSVWGAVAGVLDTKQSLWVNKRLGGW
jgi:hypothetical protein